jgi:hypothetical protein
MAVNPTLFYRGAAATSSTTLYTVPSSTTAVLTDIVISNTSSSQQYVTIAIDGVNILPTVPVSGNTVISLQPKTVIATSKTVTGYSSSTDVKYHISGVEVS